MSIFAIHNAGTNSFLFVLFAVVVIPLVLTWCILYFAGARGSLRPLYLVGAIVVPIAVALILQTRNVSIIVDGESLTVGGLIYVNKISLDKIEVKSVKKVSFVGPDRFEIGFRVNGIGMPSFRLGWFKPWVGKDLFVVASGNQAVLIPTNDDYDIVVSAADPDAFISYLRSR